MRCFIFMLKIGIVVLLTALAVKFAVPLLITGWYDGKSGIFSGLGHNNYENKESNIKESGAASNEMPQTDTAGIAELDNEDNYMTWEDAEPATDQSEDGSRIYLTVNEINGLLNAGMNDKISCISILAKLGQEKLKEMYGLLSGGVTYDEMTVIKKVLDSSLDQSEVDKLMSLLDKNLKRIASTNEGTSFSNR